MDTLITALRASAILKARNLEATLEDDGSVTIHRRGHVRGLWRGTGTEYAFYAAGSNEAQHVVTSLDDVVHITERLFDRRAATRDPS